jgi:hypothetical protein
VPSLLWPLLSACAEFFFVIFRFPFVCIMLGRVSRSSPHRLRDLLKSAGFMVETFANADDFLTYERPDTVACVIADERLTGQSGLYVQESLIANRIRLPVIFMTYREPAVRHLRLAGPCQRYRRIVACRTAGVRHREPVVALRLRLAVVVRIPISQSVLLTVSQNSTRRNNN